MSFVLADFGGFVKKKRFFGEFCGDLRENEIFTGILNGFVEIEILKEVEFLRKFKLPVFAFEFYFLFFEFAFRLKILEIHSFLLQKFQFC
jgi:hypothetical protein